MYCLIEMLRDQGVILSPEVSRMSSGSILRREVCFFTIVTADMSNLILHLNDGGLMMI